MDVKKYDEFHRKYYDENKRIEFSDQEEAYRRGYCHGFLAACRNPDLSQEEVYAWRHGNSEDAPPGSYLEGTKLHGLKKDETHRFFINKLKPKIEKDEDIDFTSFEP